MNIIYVFIEGGSSRDDRLAELREGFASFFDGLRTIARPKGIEISFIPSRGRAEAKRDFEIALKTFPNDLSILLIDSESQVLDMNHPWDHLRIRPEDLWEIPTSARDDQCHFMAQAMEAWFLADRSALKSYFGEDCYDENALSAIENNKVEDIPKNDIIPYLKSVCGKGKLGHYSKKRDAPKLLAILNPDTVRKAAPHCDRLFKIIEKTIQDQS